MFGLGIPWSLKDMLLCPEQKVLTILGWQPCFCLYSVSSQDICNFSYLPFTIHLNPLLQYSLFLRQGKLFSHSHIYAQIVIPTLSGTLLHSTLYSCVHISQFVPNLNIHIDWSQHFEQII